MGAKKENGNHCKQCNKDIGLKGRKFCNNKCQGQWRKDNDSTVTEWLSGSNPKNISSGIRRYLLEQVDNKCSQCSWGEVNQTTKKIPLEVDHIDGDHTNNDQSNLRVLCPNCHSLTSTYKGANNKPGRPWREKYRKDVQFIKSLKEKDRIDEQKANVINANIDFTQFGWCTKVSKVLGITPQKARPWMERNLPELTELLHSRK